VTAPKPKTHAARSVQSPRSAIHYARRRWIPRLTQAQLSPLSRSARSSYHRSDRPQLSKAAKLAKADAEWIPPDAVAICADAAAGVLATPVLGPDEWHNVWVFEWFV
jgi:hypothetical protein